MWSHLEQSRDSPEVLRGSGSEWSHLEQSRDGPEALRGSGSEWSHLEQSRDSPEALRGSGSEWSHLRPCHINQLDSTVESGRDQLVYVSWSYNLIFCIILVSMPTVWLG